MNEAIADAIANSQAQELAVYLLRNVPGFPPIAQAIHILGVAAIVGSTGIIDLRLLGLAVPSQEIGEMIRRLMPWTWWALLTNLLTGLPLVLARPHRYFLNPVFGIKFALLLPALLLALVVHRLGRRDEGGGGFLAERRAAAGALAALSLVLWIGVVFAGRWIAYADYLFWPE